jgi:hypothetical protein
MKEEIPANFPLEGVKWVRKKVFGRPMHDLVQAVQLSNHGTFRLYLTCFPPAANVKKPLMSIGRFPIQKFSSLLEVVIYVRGESVAG